MRHVNYRLKPLVIDSAKPKEKPYSIADGGGLLIEILPSGAKTWRFKYHLDGKREKVTIGAYPAVSIKQARDRHEELRAMVEAGQSPAKAKQDLTHWPLPEQAQEAQAKRKQEAEADTSFRSFAARWVEETLFYRSATYRAQIVRWLDAYVYPAIGDLALADVKPRHVLDIIEARKQNPTTADRIRVIIQQIYNFAIRKLLVDSNPAAPLRGSIAVPPKTHAKHLTEKQLGAFWRCLGEQGAHATTIAAVKLLAMTMVRKMELLRAKKSEFDLDAAVWDIPAERMKMKQPHRVFLSTQAVELLREVFALTEGSDYVLPSIFSSKVPMGDATLNHLFSRMDFGVSGFSPHGLRGTAATLLREAGYGKDVVELLLAHQEQDQTVASYSHIELATERAAALQFLSDRIERLAAGAEVVQLRA